MDSNGGHSLICVFVSWQDETRKCYEAAGKRPIKKVQDGGSQYTVSRQSLSQALSKGLEISVLITFGMYPPYPPYEADEAALDKNNLSFPRTLTHIIFSFFLNQILS